LRQFTDFLINAMFKLGRRFQAIYFDWGIFLRNKNSQKHVKYDKEITTYGVSLSSDPSVNFKIITVLTVSLG